MQLNFRHGFQLAHKGWSVRDHPSFRWLIRRNIRVGSGPALALA